VNWSKVFTVLDPFNQIIITALLFDNRARLLGQNADLLVTILSDEKLKNVKRKIDLACLSILRAKKQQLIAHLNSIFNPAFSHCFRLNPAIPSHSGCLF